MWILILGSSASRSIKTRHAHTWWESTTTKSLTPPPLAMWLDLSTIRVIQIAKRENGRCWTRSVLASLLSRTSKRMKNWPLITNLTFSKLHSLGAIVEQQNVKDFLELQIQPIDLVAATVQAAGVVATLKKRDQVMALILWCKVNKVEKMMRSNQIIKGTHRPSRLLCRHSMIKPKSQANTKKKWKSKQKISRIKKGQFVLSVPRRFKTANSWSFAKALANRSLIMTVRSSRTSLSKMILQFWRRESSSADLATEKHLARRNEEENRKRKSWWINKTPIMKMLKMK